MSDPTSPASPAGIAEAVRRREFTALTERAHQVVAATLAVPVDPARHLTSLGAYTGDDTPIEPVSLRTATAELRAILDDPAADPTWAARRTATVQALRELASRVLITVDSADARDYARAVSDLAVALTFETSS